MEKLLRMPQMILAMDFHVILVTLFFLSLCVQGVRYVAYMVKYRYVQKRKKEFIDFILPANSPYLGYFHIAMGLIVFEMVMVFIGVTIAYHLF